MSSDSLSENVLGGFDVDEEGAGIAEVAIKGEALTLGVDDETVVVTAEVDMEQEVATAELALAMEATTAEDVIVTAIAGVA